MHSSDSQDMASCLRKVMKVIFSYKVLAHFEVHLHQKDGLVHVQKDQNHHFRYQSPPHLDHPQFLHQNNHHFPLDHNAAEFDLHQHHHYLQCRTLSQDFLLELYHGYLPDVQCLFWLEHLLMVQLLIKCDNNMIWKNCWEGFKKFEKP